jgi:hypothetical protein
MFLALLLSSSALSAQEALPPPATKYVDVVVLDNGDVITGELKSLQQGRLKFKTDAADNIYIEWEKVRNLTAPGVFEIELESGERFFGSLRPATTRDRILIVGPTEGAEVGMLEVVRITPIKKTFWARFGGLIEFDFTFAKANEALNLTTSVDVKYRGEAVEHRLSGSTFLQSQEDIESTTRNTARWQTTRFLANRWILGGIFDVETNDELDLDIRGGIGIFGGRVLVQTNHVNWFVAGGVTGNRERFAGEESTATTFELPIGTGLDVFLFGANETTIDANLTVHPSLSDFGRVRMDFEASIRRDLFLDFFVALSGYDSFDSRPPIDTSNNDFGVSFSVGFDF